MLTGDHLLTSIATYKELGVNNKEFLTIYYHDKKIYFANQSDQKVEILNNQSLAQYNFGIDGVNLEHLVLYDNHLLEHLNVIARVDPKSKEKVIELLKKKS